MKNKIPHLSECIAYMNDCGYYFDHRSFTGLYVFFRKNKRGYSEDFAFSLKELRHAFVYGW